MKPVDVLSGSLSFVGLADLLQFLGTAAASGELRIFADNGNDGLIFMQNGDVFDARAGQDSGETAFHSLFTWQEGHFLFVPGNPDVPRKILRNFTGLILDALKNMDEQQAENDKKRYRMNLDFCLKGPSIEHSDIVDEELHKDGRAVVRQGRFGSWLWVILEGKVRIHKEIGGRSIPLFHLGKGAFVGSAASLALKDRPRNASVHAVGEVLLGVLDSQRLAKEFTTLAPVLQKTILDTDKQLNLLSNTLAVLQLGLYGLNEVEEDYQLIEMPEDIKDASFCHLKESKLILAYKKDNVFLELITFEEESIFVNPVSLSYAHRKEIVFLAKGKSKILPLAYSEMGMLWDRLSPTLRKMLSFSLSSVQTTLELIAETIENKG